MSFQKTEKNLIAEDKKAITRKSKDNGKGSEHEHLFHNINVADSGYAEVYITGVEGKKVYFDDYSIEVMSATVEDNTYDFTFQGQERQTDFGLGWYSFKWRNHDAATGRFFNVDPLAEKYVYNSTYAFSENRVTDGVELEGLETVLIVDKDQRPADNGTSGQSYSGSMYYLDQSTGDINGPYEASTYPNSKSNSDNSTNFNTVNEGEHKYNNKRGHDGASKKGLNLIDSNGNRNSPGTDASGNSVTMQYVNVHEGASDNGNYNSRGSAGCITLNPSDASAFFANFNWTTPNTNTGNSSGEIKIVRGNSQERDAAVQSLQQESNAIKIELYRNSENPDEQILQMLEYQF